MARGLNFGRLRGTWVKLFKVAPISLTYGLLVQAVDIKIVVDLANDSWIRIGDLDGILDEIVEVRAEFRLKKQALLQRVLSATKL